MTARPPSPADVLPDAAAPRRDSVPRGHQQPAL